VGDFDPATGGGFSSGHRGLEYLSKEQGKFPKETSPERLRSKVMMKSVSWLMLLIK